jgi:iron(III) transport system ATP-binding protein
MIRIQELSKRYGDAPGTPPALQSVSFSVPQGSVFTLLGPSGSGKTTLLRCIAGIDVPTGGSIAIDGRTVVSVSDGVLVPAEARNVGMVFQSYALWPHMTVFQNVAFPLKARRIGRAERERRVEEILAAVGLAEFRDRPVPRLSGGQQQRVALARALVCEPKVLLLDEPFSNLDTQLRQQTRIELRRLQARFGITCVLVTHDQDEALLISDQIALMRGGRLVEMGAPKELYRTPRSRFTAAFLGEANFLDATFLSCDPAGDALVKVGEGALTAALVDGYRPSEGEAVSLLLRPQHVRISRDGPAGTGLKGVVAGSFYRGSVVDCHVRLEDTNQVLQVTCNDEQDLPAGTEILVHAEPRTLLVYPKSDGQSHDTSG